MNENDNTTYQNLQATAKAMLHKHSAIRRFVTINAYVKKL